MYRTSHTLLLAILLMSIAVSHAHAQAGADGSATVAVPSLLVIRSVTNGQARYLGDSASLALHITVDANVAYHITCTFSGAPAGVEAFGRQPSGQRVRLVAAPTRIARGQRGAARVIDVEILFRGVVGTSAQTLRTWLQFRAEPDITSR